MGRAKKFSREEVLDKTIPLFWQHGFAGTSVQDIEHSTGVRKSGLYSEFENKDDLFNASMKRYLEELAERGSLAAEPLGWGNVEAFLKLSRGSWGQKGCFSVNSMREFADLPSQACDLMVASAKRIKRQLILNLEVARKNDATNNEMLADMVVTFFCGICVEQNLRSSEKRTSERISQFMQLIRQM